LGNNPKIEISIKNKNYALSENISANRNCNNIFVLLQSQGMAAFPYLLEMTFSPEGTIRSMVLADYKDQNKTYKTSVFNPEENLKVQSFSLDPSTNLLSLSFEGKLPLPFTTEFVEVSAKIENIPFKTTNCTQPESTLSARFAYNAGPTPIYQIYDFGNPSNGLERLKWWTYDDADRNLVYIQQ
jgi:hypothetical protein